MFFKSKNTKSTPFKNYLLEKKISLNINEISNQWLEKNINFKNNYIFSCLGKITNQQNQTEKDALSFFIRFQNCSLKEALLTEKIFHLVTDLELTPKIHRVNKDYFLATTPISFSFMTFSEKIAIIYLGFLASAFNQVFGKNLPGVGVKIMQNFCFEINAVINNIKEK